VLLSVLYVAFQRTLQFLFLRFQSTPRRRTSSSSSFATSWRFCAARSGDRRFARPTGDPVGRKPAAAAHQLVDLCGHSGDAPPVAPASCRQALDLYATTASANNHRGRPSFDRAARPGESAVGLAIDCEHAASAADGQSLRRSLQQLATSPELRAGTPEWSYASPRQHERSTDQDKTSRPAWRAGSRV
jgi:hypothetical protein